MAVATSISESFSTMKPEKAGRASAVTMPGNRATKSKVEVDIVPVGEAGAVILTLLCYRCRFNFVITALVHQIRSKNGNGHVVGIRLVILVVPAVGLHGLLINFFLQLDEACNESLRCGRTAGDVNVNGQKFINARNYVIALFERSAARSTRAHCDDILWLGHLIVKTHDGWHHFLGDRAGNEQEVCLARCGAHDLHAKACHIVARGLRGDHFNGATCQTEHEGPY